MQQYLNLLRDILDNGKGKSDPQKVGNISSFVTTSRYKLKDGFPLITTRSLKNSWKAIVGELLWFLSGSTRIKDLHQNGIHVWDQWATPEICEELGLESGELGPIYGKQWRSFGSAGIDQVEYVIKLLKRNPDSRRIKITAWNPEDLDKVFVAPCHEEVYFYHQNGNLSLCLVQRSADFPIGVPFNIAEYSLFLLMVAQVVDMNPNEFVHVTIDSHIYDNQIEPVKELLLREPRPLPRVRINPDKKDIFKFNIDDFELLGYNPHPPIKIPVSL